MDEEKDIQETKDKIVKEIKEIESRLAEAQDNLDYEMDFFSGDAGLEEAKKKVEFEKKDLEHWKDLEKVAEARLIEIRKQKQQKEPVPPFIIAIIDLIDAYHYADVFDQNRYAWLGWQDYAHYTDLDVVIGISDRLFWALNHTAKTQEEWYEWDAGYDVRVYDKDMKCVYKAHEKLPEGMPIPKVGDIIYLETENEMGDLILGGKAKIFDVEHKPGRIFIKVEGFSELTYGWKSLEPQQDELKKKFGEQWFHREIIKS